jgi:hypothetical protein
MEWFGKDMEGIWRDLLNVLQLYYSGGETEENLRQVFGIRRLKPGTSRKEVIY